MQKSWWSITFYGIFGCIIYVYLYYSIHKNGISLSDSFDYIILSIILGGISGLIFWFLSKNLNKILPWKKISILRLIVQFFSSTISISVVVLGILFLHIKFLKQTNYSEIISLNNDFILKFLILSSLLVIITSILDFTLFSYNQYSQIQIKNQKLKRNLLHLQFDALKSQLNPHYLFNSLNTISSLIYKDKGLADEFIRSLAKSLDYIMETHKVQIVSLKKEIEIARAYIFMMSIRFGGSFNINWKINETSLSKNLPPLTIQMLIENALKHNHLSPEEPLQIDIIEHNKSLIVSNIFKPKSNYFEIDNKLLKKPHENQSTKIGLANIKKRYSFFTDQEVIIKSRENFSVEIPLLEPRHE